MRSKSSAVLLLLVCSVSKGAEAQPSGETPPHARRMPFPTLFWLAAQLPPSPGIAFGAREISLDLRWQITPLLYGWGVNRRVTGWRSLVVEPNVRFGGSLELYVSPEVVISSRSTFMLRPGLRATFPVLERGETLSVSIGTSYQQNHGVQAVAFEAGAHILFGILGAQISHTPGRASPAQTIATLQLRYF
jgi:hypothetical protein